MSFVSRSLHSPLKVSKFSNLKFVLLDLNFVIFGPKFCNFFYQTKIFSDRNFVSLQDCLNCKKGFWAIFMVGIHFLFPSSFSRRYCVGYGVRISGKSSDSAERSARNGKSNQGRPRAFVERRLRQPAQPGATRRAGLRQPSASSSEADATPLAIDTSSGGGLASAEGCVQIWPTDRERNGVLGIKKG